MHIMHFAIAPVPGFSSRIRARLAPPHHHQRTSTRHVVQRNATQRNSIQFNSIQFAVTTNSTLSRPPPEARWYTRDELLAVLSHNEGTTLSRQEHKEIAASAENSNPHEKPDDANAQPTAAAASTAPAAAAAAATAPVNMNRGPPFKIPPRTAIGGVILSEWAHGRAGPQPVSSQTANL